MLMFLYSAFIFLVELTVESDRRVFIFSSLFSPLKASMQEVQTLDYLLSSSSSAWEEEDELVSKEDPTALW